MANEIYDKIELYSKAIEEDTEIDLLNLRDKIMSSAKLKHKWLYKLTMEKKHLLELMERKEAVIAAKFSSNPLNLSKASINASANRDTTVIDINKDIQKQELLVVYLDSAVNKIFTQMGYDFKNLVDLIKQESLD